MAKRNFADVFVGANPLGKSGSCAAYYFCGKSDKFLEFLMNRKFETF